MQALTLPPGDRQYAFSIFSLNRNTTHVTPPVERPWLVFEAKDDEGRRVLWEKWLEIREKWAGDSASWK